MAFDPCERADNDDSLTIRGRRDPSRPIESVEEWRELAAPAGGARQWRCGRSAKECARSWFRDGRPRMPKELSDLFIHGPDELSGFEPVNVVPEWKTYFMDGPWGPRNHDVLICGFAGATRVVVGVEVKADEPLDQPVGKRLQSAFRRRDRGERTKFPERVERFSRALFGFPALTASGDVDPRVAHIPYQLLSGSAGTIVEAAKAGAMHAVFIVHVLDSGALDEKKLDSNRIGLRAFCKLLGVDVPEKRDGWLLGPASYPGTAETSGGSELPVLKLFIGWAHGRC